MKKILALVLVLVSVNAFATRARTTALAGSFHLVDTQTEFSSPYHLFSIPDFVSLESGKTTAASTTDGAEGIAKMSINDSSKFLVAIGHKDETAQTQRTFLNKAATKAFVTQQNPVELMYGVKLADGTIWAGGLYFSNFKDKVADNNEQSMGLRVGASHGDFKWKVNLGLTNKVQNTTDGTFTSQPYASLGLRYGIDKDKKFGFDYTTWKAKAESTTGLETQSHDYQAFKLQYVNTTQADGNDFFYGVSLDSVTLKNSSPTPAVSGNFTRLALPVWFGVEHNATEMFTVRASIKQTVWGQSKDESGYVAGSVEGVQGGLSEMAAEPNTTVVSAGMGLKFQKFTLDGTLAGLTGATATQQVNSNTLFALVGGTYWF